MASVLKKVTAVGQAYTGNAILKSVVLTHTAAAGVLDVTDASATGGTVLLTIRCAADTTAVWRSADPDGVYFGTGIRAEAITGAATFEFEPAD